MITPQEFKKYSGEQKYQWLLNNNFILFETISGSHLYGTNISTSDIDKKFVYYLPQDWILSNGYIEQVDIHADYVGYEIKRFLELLWVNNPNILELTSIVEGCLLICNPIYKEYIIDQANSFITKKSRFSFGGYAVEQIKKARGLNKKIVNPMPAKRATVLDFCHYGKGQGSECVKKWLEENNIPQEYCGLVAVDHMKNTYHLFVDRINLGQVIKTPSKYSGIVSNEETSNDVCLSSIEKGLIPDLTIYFNLEGYQVNCKQHKEYWSWEKNKNMDRYNLNAEVQFDRKNLMHCYRLLNMCNDIFDGKGIVIRRPEKEMLLKIRTGNASYEELIEGAEKLVKEIDEKFALSTLPEELNQEKMYDLLLNIRKELYHLI